MSPEAPGWRALLSRDHVVYVIILGGGVMLYALDIYIAATVLPSAVKEIGGLDYYAWSTTLFVIAAIFGSAVSGRVLHAIGPRGAYSTAALVFALGTAICALAPSMPVMLAGRTLQGFGGGGFYALAYVVVRLVLPEALWTRAIGLMSAIWGVATLVGPAVGGTFAELGAWRFAFWAAIPFSAAFAVLAFVSLPKRDSDKAADAGLPFVQLALLILTVLVLSSASAASNVLWTVAGAGAVVSLALVALLIVVETQGARRILPSGAHGFETPLGALYAMVALLVIGIQPQIFVPYFLQVLHGQSPLLAGYFAALMAMGWTLGSVISANISGAGTRRLMLASPLMMLAALCVLAALLPVTGGDWPILLPICAALLLAGVGIGQSWPHLVARVFQLAPEGERNRAAGAVTTVQLFATAMGAATAGLAANLAGLTQGDKVAGATAAAFWLPVAFMPAAALAFAAALRAVAPPKPEDTAVGLEERVDDRVPAE